MFFVWLILIVINVIVFIYLVSRLRVFLRIDLDLRAIKNSAEEIHQRISHFKNKDVVIIDCESFLLKKKISSLIDLMNNV